MVDRLQLPQLDLEKAALGTRHSGWRIWYVPHAINGSVTWCAQRLPLLNCHSPAELEEAITEAEAEHLAEAQAFGKPTLDSESPPPPAER